MATNPTLRFGSRGSLVEELQHDLNVILPVEPLLAEDGIFGPKTHARVKALQSRKDLTSDGVVGPLTWSSILDWIAVAGEAAGAAAGLVLLNPARLAIAQVAWFEWRLHGAMVHARQKGDYDSARKRYHRQGWQFVTDYFATGCPNYEDVWGKDVTRFMPYGGQKDELPAWCGIFAVAMLRKALQPVGVWRAARGAKHGYGISSVSGIKRTDNPRTGDVAYRELWKGLRVQHHAIVYDTIGTGKNATIVTIDGNSPPGSSVAKNQAPRSAWDFFYKVESIVDP